MLNVFKKKEVNLIEQHQEASNKAFGLFNETLNQLTDANTNVDSDVDGINGEIESLKEERDALIAIAARNNKLYSKINKFFEL